MFFNCVGTKEDVFYVKDLLKDWILYSEQNKVRSISIRFCGSPHSVWGLAFVAWWIIIHTILKASAAPVEHEACLSGSWMHGDQPASTVSPSRWAMPWEAVGTVSSYSTQVELKPWHTLRIKSKTLKLISIRSKVKAETVRYAPNSLKYWLLNIEPCPGFRLLVSPWTGLWLIKVSWTIHRNCLD